MAEAEDLYRQIADLAPSADPAGALSLGNAHWTELAARDPNPHDAETCRLLSLAAIEQDSPDFVTAEVWRTRALARFTLTGWHEGVAAVVMGRAFTALSLANDDYVQGKSLDVVRGSQAALDLLDELGLFLRAAPSGISVGPRSPSRSVLARFLHEKRGFLLLTLGRLDEARASYEKAAVVAEGNPRGTVKVRLGRALVDYLAGARSTALAETTAAVEEAVSLREEDLIEIGEHNIVVMKRGGSDLHPYEIL